MNDVEDDKLIRLSQQGSVEAFNALIERYQKEALNIAFRMLGNLLDAEDVCQVSWLSAWKSIRNFRGGSFRAWELSIVSNACRDELRKRKRKRNMETSITDCSLPSTDGFTDDIVLTREKVEAVQKALLQLPYEQRLAVILRVYGDLNYKEISKVMKCPLGTVRSRLNRGLYYLRDLLRDGESL
ncbi:MAG: RNA polymerase sigma factor [Dehalococcoidales bacterium]|nr:RNA polymerase sigma factor [Dehalococcoidales bacterium]